IFRKPRNGRLSWFAKKSYIWFINLNQTFMKKLLWMLSVAFFASCATNKMALPEPYTTVSIVDYKFYTERGFFITESNSVSFEYTPVSSIVVKSVPGFLPGNYKPKVDPKINNDMYSSRGKVTDTKNPLFADVT